MIIYMKSFIILILLIIFSCTKVAQAEEILNFHSLIKLNTQGDLQIAESISYDYGAFARHGIDRYLPLSYHYLGTSHRLSFDKFQVADHIFTSHRDGDRWRLRIGDAKKLLTGLQLYNLSYQVKGAVSRQADQDEVFWHLSGYGWPVVINTFSADLQLPRALKPEQIKAQCFFGQPNSTTPCQRLTLQTNAAGLVTGLSLTQSQISAGQGVSLVLHLPKGLIKKPYPLIPFLGFLFIFIISVILWHKSTGKK